MISQTMEKQHKFNLLSSLLLFLFLISCGTKLVCGEGSISSGTAFFLYQQSGYPRDCNEVFSSCSSTQNISGVYMIKPNGYPEPFEVYCDSEVDTGGWTVLQRRHMGLINFTRQWDESKTGFGFLGSEFWIGNEKLAFLTNQKQYQLRIDFTNTAGEMCYVTYDRFRISDEWGDYSLLSVGNLYGSIESCVEWCPPNTVFSSETCEYSCDDPETCIPSASERCACIGDNKIQQGNCIPQDQCDCYDSVKGSVIRNGESYVNADCTRLSHCSNNQLSVNESYGCGTGSTCGEIDGVSTCIPIMFTTTAIPDARDCHELYLTGVTTDGVYTIYPDGYPSGIQVKCEMESNGGGWTVIQRRSSASVDFYRTWNEYRDGFEDPSGDHWLGNDYIHSITAQKTYSLRIDLTDRNDASYHALYSSFSISDGTDKYRLSISGYSGTAGFDAMALSNNERFSTRDQDNDGSSFDCAERHRGAWWYPNGGCGSSCCSGSCTSDCDCRCPGSCISGQFCQSSEGTCDYFPDGSSCSYCVHTHLNGDYDGSTRGTNIFWTSLGGYDCGLQFADMKIRPSA